MQQLFPAQMSVEHYRALRQDLIEAFSATPFHLIGIDGVVRMIFDSRSKLLWNARPGKSNMQDATQLPDLAWGAARAHWRPPGQTELRQLHDAADCPGHGQLEFFRNSLVWQTHTGTILLAARLAAGVVQDNSVHLIETNDVMKGVAATELLDLCMERDWALFDGRHTERHDLLAPLRAAGATREQYRDIDYRTTRLPRLEPAQFDDPAKGLWECWGMDAELLREQRLRARDPFDDVRDWDVAIDFGTSSTVVAYEENGRRKLLRAGIGNFLTQESAANYENPTMLEFLDWDGLLQAWQTVAYRPPVDWQQVRASHDALNDFLHSDAPHALIGSLLNNIKQWALNAEDGARVFIRDSGGDERELLALTVRNPVLGAPLEVDADDRFDPVELYAWLLGLNINWRGRGLFLRYAMTFPVAYPQLVKDKILASFRRGLQRSLPATLVGAAVFSRFSVDEVASEPAAYAVAALPSLGIEPSVAGVAYAVFDFGGGTADFDFGLYRLPKDGEDDDLEQILERLGSAGDRHLGGENLLANMAYLVFRHNLALCDEFGIIFSRPPDALQFKGQERFVEQSRIAATNMVIMATVLRPLWEGDEAGSMLADNPLNLLNRHGQRVSCQFQYPEAGLRAYLEQRIGEGVCTFLVAMQKAYAGATPGNIHVLLAGNSSRSRLVEGYFGLCADDEGQRLHALTRQHLDDLFGQSPPELTIHPALRGDGDDLFQPTAKTGVALGLLRLCPGGVAAVVDSSGSGEAGEAPFAFYVGRIRQGRFKSVLMQGQPYRAWVELGRLREAIFKLDYSHSPLAYAGMLEAGAVELSQLRLELVGDVAGQYLFVRAVGPAEIEICTAPTLADAGADGAGNLQRLKLA